MKYAVKARKLENKKDVSLLVIQNYFIKGQSHGIDFKILTKFTELELTKGRGWILKYLGAPMIL